MEWEQVKEWLFFQKSVPHGQLAILCWCKDLTTHSRDHNHQHQFMRKSNVRWLKVTTMFSFLYFFLGNKLVQEALHRSVGRRATSSSSSSVATRINDTAECEDRQTSGLICSSCAVVSTCTLVNDKWDTISVAHCDNEAGMFCNIRQGGCSDLAGESVTGMAVRRQRAIWRHPGIAAFQANNYFNWFYCVLSHSDAAAHFKWNSGK